MQRLLSAVLVLSFGLCTAAQADPSEGKKKEVRELRRRVHRK